MQRLGLLLCNDSGMDPVANDEDDKNRTIITYTIIGLIVVAVIVAIVVFAVSRGDDSKPVASTTTTSTTAATTTSSAPDPRQKYVGMGHDDRGAGLELGTSVRSIGYQSAYDRELRVNDYAYTWVRDARGDMLWLDQVTKVLKADPVELKVVAVWDLPAITDEQMLCLGWCYDKDDKADTSVVGIFDGDAKPVKLWRIDVSKPSMDVIASAGWKLYPEVQEGADVPLADRPELYGIVALASSEDMPKYTALEQVSAGGGAAYTSDAFLYPVEDFKENKRAVVLARDRVVQDIAVTDYVSGANFNLGAAASPHFNYDGKPDGNLFVYASYNGSSLDKIYAAWRIDPKTYKIASVDKSKVTEIKP